MSEPIPEAIPISAKRSSKLPQKRQRTLNTPSGQLGAQLDALFANPDRPINIPPSTSNTLAKSAPLPPEIVPNVQGSSAGAGSGEFHVYKASRRREYERLRVMDAVVEQEERDEEFRRRKEEREKEDEAKLARNRAKRAKKALRQQKGGKGDDGGGVEAPNGASKGAQQKKGKLGPARVVGANGVVGENERAEDDAVDDAPVPAAEEGGGITFHDDD